MNAAHMPPGTRLQLLRELHEQRFAARSSMGTLAHQFGISYAEVREILDDLVDTSGQIASLSKLADAIADLEAQLAAPTPDDASDAGDDPIGEDQQVEDAAVAVGFDGSSEQVAITPRPAPNPLDVKNASSRDGHLTRVLTRNLHVDPDNVRDLPSVDDPDIGELADSISELGLLQPITARRHDNGRLVIVMGHRRYVACKRLRWDTIPVIVRQPMRSVEVLAAMLVENGQRRDLNPIEEARGLRRLAIDLGQNDQPAADMVVARKVGRSAMHVGNRLALLALSAEQQAAIAAGDMSITEGTAKGRLSSGRLGKTGLDRNWHLGPLHALADAAKARCRRLQHSRGRTVGGMACGECWESVIRADTRQDFVDVSHKTGECPVCHHPVERHTTHPDTTPAGATA